MIGYVPNRNFRCRGISVPFLFTVLVCSLRNVEIQKPKVPFYQCVPVPQKLIDERCRLTGCHIELLSSRYCGTFRGIPALNRRVSLAGGAPIIAPPPRPPSPHNRRRPQ